MKTQPVVRLKVILAIVAVAVAVVAMYLPNFVVRPRDRLSLNACIANLKQIDGAKATWALENHITNLTVEVKPSDIYGPTHYIRDVLSCTHTGTYTIGTLSEKPRCSVPWHTL